MMIKFSTVCGEIPSYFGRISCFGLIRCNVDLIFMLFNPMFWWLNMAESLCWWLNMVKSNVWVVKSHMLVVKYG